jgi:hypothetical protein
MLIQSAASSFASCPLSSTALGAPERPDSRFSGWASIDAA